MVMTGKVGMGLKCDGPGLRAASSGPWQLCTLEPVPSSTEPHFPCLRQRCQNTYLAGIVPERCICVLIKAIHVVSSMQQRPN